MTEGPFGRDPGATGDEEDRGQSPTPKGGENPPPEPTRAPVKQRRRPSSTTWIVSLLLVALVVYVTANTLTTDGPGSRGIVAGQEVPPFAAPLALADLKCEGGEECDVNVLIKESDGVPKACDVRGPQILNSCELEEKGPLVLAFLVAPSEQCIDQIDVLDKLRPRYPGVEFAAIAIKGNHADLNEIIRDRGWEIPVAYDHDGALANTFAVAVCPTITFADTGGKVQATTLGTASEAEIVKHLRELR
jgi:AhpC/TSA family